MLCLHLLTGRQGADSAQFCFSFCNIVRFLIDFPENNEWILNNNIRHIQGTNDERI